MVKMSDESPLIRVLELYSGIGGMHYALQESGIGGHIVAAVDINTVANEVYRHNFPHVALMNRNIQSISLEEIHEMCVDTILMSPPCQPFTRTGLQKDAADNRSSSLFHVLALIPQMKNLKYILLENVKGFEKSKTRDALIRCIDDSGFHYTELILSPCQFGIPNTRHRYYLLAKKKDLPFCFDHSLANFDLPQEAHESLPISKHNVLVEKFGVQNLRNGRKCYTISAIIEGTEDTEKHLIPKKVLGKRAWGLDIRSPESSGSCCFTKAYGHYVEGTGSVFCSKSEDTVRERFTEAEKHGRSSAKAMEILEELKLRYFSDREVSRLMCFPEEFTFPNHITVKQRYRLLGNSINVHVVSRLIFLLHTDNMIR